MIAVRRRRATFFIVFGVAIGSAIAGCAPVEAPTEQVRPTPTPGPPSLRFSSSTGWTSDGHTWEISVIVETKGLPTDVLAEYHLGLEDGPFDQSIAVADDVIDAGRVSIHTTELPVDKPFCLRFTATNELGIASTVPHCLPGFPSGAPPPASP